ncbi:Alpha-amylase A type-1/2 [Cymbomonas tetramitiformis]|uniref:alpha-amylase n=1 Tax=Cymbomonas tetramitiformis TaxID=36881 RepID=A0AAE0L850_9CHLO|nr:Alpha-amylase A type-1/2 [Cymbomonas tetramitiformis]
MNYHCGNQNPELREGLVAWLTWLHTHVGFDSWRFDFVRGFAPHFVKQYIEDSLKDAKNSGINIGEYWTDGGPSELAYFVRGTSGTCMAFDFPLKGELHNAITHMEYDHLAARHDGKPPGLVGIMPESAVTFVENHDTGKPLCHWEFPQDRVMVGYAYILTHPGIPAIFYSHLFGDGESTSGPYSGELAEEIQALIQLRRNAKITNASIVRIIAAEQDMYEAVIDDKVTVKLGPRWDMGDRWPGDTEWEVATCGLDYCIWAHKSLGITDTDTLLGEAQSAPTGADNIFI